MTTTFVQTACNSTANGNTVNAPTAASPFTAGNTLVVIEYHAAGATVASFVTTGGTGSETFNNVGTFTDSGGLGLVYSVWLVQSVGTGRTGIRITYNIAPGFCGLYCWEIGGQTNTVLDKFVVLINSSAASPAAIGSTGTLSSADQFAVTMASSANAVSSLTSTGATFISEAETANADLGGHAVVTSNAALNVSYSYTGPPVDGLIATFMSSDGWDPTSSTNYTYSAGNSTATAIASNDTAVRSIAGHASGKWYAEVKNTGFGSGGCNIGIGDFTFNNTTSTTNGGTGLTNSGGTNPGGVVINSGDVLGIAVDSTANKVWFKNITTNSGWNNGVIGSQNPATGTGGFSGMTPIGAWFIFSEQAQAGCVTVLNTGGTVATFVGAIPSGFSAWNGSASGGGSTAALLGRTMLVLTARAVPSGKVHISGASRVAVTGRPAQTATAKLSGTIKAQVSGRSKPAFPARLAGNTLAAVKTVSRAAGKVAISGASKIAIMGRLAKPGAIALLGRAFVAVMGRAAPRGATSLQGAMTLTVKAKATPTFGQKLAGAMKIVVGSQTSLLGKAGLSGMTVVKTSGVASMSRIAALAATTKIGLSAAASMSGRVALSGATKITSSTQSTLSHLGQFVQLSGATAFRLAARALLFIFEPSSRFAIVPVEDRTATAPTEIRSVSVPVEVRTATVPTEIRSASVLVENRSAIVPPNT